MNVQLIACAILFALFVEPMFDNNDLTSYADDSYLSASDNDPVILSEILSREATKLARWFKASGLKVNETKTEFCVFHKNSQRKFEIVVENTTVSETGFIKVLGITFDKNFCKSIKKYFGVL